MQKLLLPILSLILSITSYAQQFDTYIQNINIIPIHKDTLLPNQYVGISNNQIVYIGKDIKPKAKQTLNGTNKYLMPGMYDMHIHWPHSNPQRFLQLCLAAGITKARVMNSEPEALTFINKDNKNTLPELSVGFPITKNTVRSTESIPSLIDSAKKAGYHFVKLFYVDKAEHFPEIMKAAKANNMTVCGHSLGKVPAAELLQSGYRSVEHVGYLDNAKNGKLDTLLQLFAENKTFICPTLDWEMMVYHSTPFDELPTRAGYTTGYSLYKTEWDTTYAKATEGVSEAEQAKRRNMMQSRVKNKLEVLAKVRQANIPLIAGSDAEEPFQTPGYSLIDELLLIQKAGYTNYELLKMATLNPARFFNEEKTAGTVETSKQAHLLILTKNPLTDVRNLQSVETILYGNAAINKEELIKKIQ